MGLDKWYHFIASFAIALIDPVLAVWAGLGKEFWDVLRSGTIDLVDLVGDLIADVLGILLALAF